MRHTRQWRATVAITVGVALALTAACSGGDDDSDTDNDIGDDTGDIAVAVSATSADDDGTADASTSADTAPSADLPPECSAEPMEIEVVIDGVDGYDGPFVIEGAAATATPIVPNGDGALDDLGPGEFTELGAETDLLVYSQWIGDHAFGADDVGFLGGPDTPDGAITLGLAVTPTNEAGLATGDVVSSTDELEYDSITTFATASVFFQPAEGVETWMMVDNLDPEQGGTAEVLYVDDNWLCVDWSLAGETRDPEGTYSISGVVLTPIERLTLPFT